MQKAAMMADDLTGAMDTGIQLAKKGLAVHVVLESTCLERILCECDAVMIDTESRNISPEAAFDSVQAWRKELHRCGLMLAYKKVDSTLRGNLGKEMEALIAHSDAGLLLFAPALPASGRTTREGIQYLYGRPLTESDLAADPFAPVASSTISTILGCQTALETGLVPIHTVKAGADKVVEALKGMMEAGCRVAICDAETQDDLDVLADALQAANMNILPCGSAGLFTSLCRHIPGQADARREDDKPWSKEAPMLVISGSPAAMSKKQIEAAEVAGYDVLRFDPADRGEFKAIEQQVLERLAQKRSVVFDAAGKGKREISLMYVGSHSRMAEDSRGIREKLAGLAEKACHAVNLSGLVIFGGETAVDICRRLGAGSIRIAGEVEELVPCGIIQIPGNRSLRVVTKAGGLGSEGVIRRCEAYLKE